MSGCMSRATAFGSVMPRPPFLGAWLSAMGGGGERGVGRRRTTDTPSSREMATARLSHSVSPMRVTCRTMEKTLDQP